MYVALLGRQPVIGMAELEIIYDSDHVAWFSDHVATINTDQISIERLGGILKAGQISATLSHGDWRTVSMKIVQTYTKIWANFDGKLTLGISAYGFDVSSREVQKTGIILKQKLRQSGVSLRMIPNIEPALTTATSHHNKLGLSNNHVELLVFRNNNGKIVIAKSTGSQNITALAKRDQERPRRDAFVGMLPPKLAQIMINLTAPRVINNLNNSRSIELTQPRILDPFCGTGVILQEAALMHYAVYGTDLSEKMIRYSRDNLNWLRDTLHSTPFDWYLHEGDAMTTQWQQPIDAVVCETYLGQPFSAPPSSSKLTEVKNNCNHIITSFLKNIASQLQSETPLCIAVPAWRDTKGSFSHLPLIDNLEEIGYRQIKFKNAHIQDLLYYRPDQVVARELLVLAKI